MQLHALSSVESRNRGLKMDSQPITTPVREAHRFDEDALKRYLAKSLPGFSGSCLIAQFEGGQSNPTFLLEDGSQRYVLRKKPPGKLLPSAHAVEREYRVMQALAESDVPVCRMLLLCEDSDVIGTPFIVMEHVDGRVFHSPTLPGVPSAERRAVYLDSIRVLAALHAVRPEEVGLEGFGRPGNYYARQINRWTRQYKASETREIPSMDRLMEWLPENIPSDETTRIVHGDYRLGNMILHASQPRIVAVLDWELSTLGDPLADLSYNQMTHFLTSSRAPTLADNAPAESGIPSHQDQLDEYCKLSGRVEIENWEFYLAFSMFRSAAIGQGVYKRGLDGNASSTTALESGRDVKSTADTAWHLASNGI